MKSDREFIDGIYKKAAKIEAEGKSVSTEDKYEKRKVLHQLFGTKGQRGILVAASVCLCIFGYFMIGRKPSLETIPNEGEPQLRTSNYMFEDQGEEVTRGVSSGEEVYVAGEILSWNQQGDSIVLSVKPKNTQEEEDTISFAIANEITFTKDYIKFSNESDKKSYVGDILIFRLIKIEDNYEAIDTTQDVYYPVGDNSYESFAGQKITEEE